MKHRIITIIRILSGTVSGLFLSLQVGAATVTKTDDLFRKIPGAREMGFRNSAELRAYFEIREVLVTEEERTFSADELALTDFKISNALLAGVVPQVPEIPVNSGGSVGGLITDLAKEFGDVSKWVTLGLKLWDVVKANQPVVRVQTQTVSVLPQSHPDWQQMETWKGPQAKSFTIAAKNVYGTTVVSQTYTIAFHYGGSYLGHGQFLANATIIPTDVNVSWGFTLNSEVKVGDPLNSGTTANPVPGIGLGLEWSMSSFLKKLQGRDEFYVRGDGTTSHVNL